MTKRKLFYSNERGTTLVEFAIAATVFLTAMFGVIEFGRALWTHNALADAARRGARYAVLHAPGDANKVKNMVVFGDENGGSKPLVPNLSAANVNVNYSNYALNKGTATVSITNYKFQFVLPIVHANITMPAYATTLTGENAGFIPADK
jgi:Flp pilus assembly protein TadG